MGDAAQDKQNMKNQYIAIFLVCLGLAATFAGCHFHYTELTTAAVGVVGIGGGLLTNQHSQNNLRASGSIAVNADPGIGANQ